MTKNVKKIFLVDNEKKILTLLERFLLEGGYNNFYDIYSYEDGLQVLKVFNKKKPYIMILDHDMPSISGLDMLKQLKSKNQLEINKTNIIVTTSNYDALEMFKQMNIIHFLPKPFSKEDLWNVIDIL